MTHAHLRFHWCKDHRHWSTEMAKSDIIRRVIHHHIPPQVGESVCSIQQENDTALNARPLH